MTSPGDVEYANYVNSKYEEHESDDWFWHFFFPSF